MRRGKNLSEYRKKNVFFLLFFTTTPVLLLNWIFFSFHFFFFHLVFFQRFIYFYTYFFAVMQGRSRAWRLSQSSSEMKKFFAFSPFPLMSFETFTHGTIAPSSGFSPHFFSLLMQPRTAREPPSLFFFLVVFFFLLPRFILHCCYLHWSPPLLWIFCDVLFEPLAADRLICSMSWMSDIRERRLQWVSGSAKVGVRQTHRDMKRRRWHRLVLRIRLLLRLIKLLLSRRASRDIVRALGARWCLITRHLKQLNDQRLPRLLSTSLCETFSFKISISSSSPSFLV